MFKMLTVDRSSGAAILFAILVWGFFPANVAADAWTEALQGRVRELHDKQYNKAPSPCTSFAALSSSKERIVVDMTPWAAASGLRRGDRLVAVAGTRLAGASNSENEVWAQVPKGEYVDIRVERAGSEISLRIPCRDDRPAWETTVAMEQAIIEGRWQDCMDSTQKHSQLKGMASASHLLVAVVCMRGKMETTKQLPSDEYWRLLHRWATKAIDEARYLPTGLTEMQGTLVGVAEGLEKAGQKNLADDIKQQIAGFSQAPGGHE